jgi:hypothetical protein
LTTGDFNIAIGNGGIAGESATIRIGNDNQTRAFIAGIRGVTTDILDALPVLIDSKGQLGTIVSSRRYKQDIRDMGDLTNDLMKLRPVTFTYKSDDSGATQYGLIAEEVAQVFPELAVYSADGQIETVRYHLLSSILLNELQKQHKINEQQKRELDEVKSRLEQLEMTVQRFAEQNLSQMD